MSDTIDQPANVLAPAPVGFNWMNLWTAAGGVAGAAAVVYCVGFGIEALRLNAAGLPVTEALAVIPKTALVSLAIDAIFLKVLIQGVLTALFMIWAKGRAAAMTAPEAVLRRGERANARKRRWQTVQASLAPLSRLFRSARRLLGRVTRALQIHRAARAALRLFLLILRGAVIVWRHTLSHVRHKFWITLGLLYAFLVPWTAFTLYATVIVVFQARALSAVSRRRDAGIMSIRAEAVLLGVITACSVASMTLIGEAIRPGPLPRVAVNVEGAPKPIIGDYVSTTNDGVYIGVHRKLTLIPDHRVSTVTIYNAPEQKPERSQTLLQRLR
ncbi:MAG TPA: hypothetical protein VK778_15815 [Solirubrobacteraceae bacterium]|jgi:hypothetical protein|nr:hypothetical protein [Solirubrobacteraceae bacterium]